MGKISVLINLEFPKFVVYWLFTKKEMDDIIKLLC